MMMMVMVMVMVMIVMVVCCSRPMNYPDTNGGVSSPFGSEQNPFDQSFDHSRPAMTSSQQDIRPAPPHSGPVSYMPSGGPTGRGVRMPYPDERLSDHGSSVANPLDERFSEAESSVIGYGDPAVDPRYSGDPWRPADNVGPGYERGQLISWYLCFISPHTDTDNSHHHTLTLITLITTHWHW